MDERILTIADRIGCDIRNISQEQVIEIIKDPFRSSWTDVYSASGELPESLHMFSCFATPELKTCILSGQDWLKHADGFTPGFSVSSEETVYESPCSDGFEFLVAEQYFHALDEEQLILNHEFILLLGLYRGSDGNYYEIDESGEKSLVVDVSNKRVRVKTKLLMSYMNAKQLLYVQFVDSRVSTAVHYPHGAECISHDEYHGDTYNYFVNIQTTSAEDYLFSMIYARSIVLLGPIQECGIWPFEKCIEEYPEFIIGELPDGSFVRFTCEESKLSNYFGANPGAPHYLTPVFFKPAVLDRYRKRENFEVTERRIRCGSQWSVEIDNIIPGRVMVYLGDLGRDLPETERKHFLAYEMSPSNQRVAEEVIAQDFFCAWIEETEGPISRFQLAYIGLNKSWANRFGTSLFRVMHPDDANLIKQIRIPTINSSEEYETVIQSLARLLVDYIDQAQFPKSSTTGSINKLKEFLQSQGINIDCSPLHDLQNLRSTGVAHAKGEKYDKTKAQLLSGNSINDVAIIIDRLTNFMQELSNSLQSMSDELGLSE